MPTVAEEMNEILEKNLNEMETRFKNFISETLDKHLSEFKTALVAIQEGNVDLKKDISILKKETDEMKEEIKKMRDMMSRDQADLAELEQYSHHSNVRIFGLPVKENENCKQTIDTLLKEHLQIEDLSSADIEVAHRLPSTRNGPKPMIVRFRGREL